MIRKLTLYSLVGFILFSACKKSSSDNKPNLSGNDSVAILGKWRVLRSDNHEFAGNVLINSNIAQLSPNDYVIFDGKLVYQSIYENPIDGTTKDTVAYRVYNNTSLILQNPGEVDTAKMAFQKDSSLLVTSQYTYESNSVPMVTINGYDTLLLAR